MDAKAFLMGSGNPGFSFSRPGDRIVGQIIAEPTMQQQKVYGTNDPAVWPSGDPKMQMLVNVSTSFRNYEGIANPDRAQPDTGARTIYVKGKHFERACREAVRDAGAAFLDVGGWLDITYTGDDMTSKAGMKPKLFTVRYMAPRAQAAVVQSVAPVYLSQQPSYITQQQPNPWGIQAPATPQPQLPAHHEQGPPPAWAQEPAQPVSAVPVSAGPPMSTLEAIRAAQQNAQVASDEIPF